MTERKGHETGEKDQQLYSNLSIKCAGSAEHRQSVSECFIFNLLLCPSDFSGSKKPYKEDWEGLMYIFLIYLKGTND